MQTSHFSKIAAAALIASVSTLAAAQNIAIVNGKAVPKERLEALAKQSAQAGRPVPAEAMGQLRDEVIAREIFAQEAQKRGLDATEEYKSQVEFARQNLLIRELFNQYQKENAVTDAEMKAEYDKFAAANTAKEYRARHILVEKEADAKDIIARLKKGAKFEDIAKKQSKDPGSGANGGNLDWAPAGNYVKEFADALTALTKGKITETPVKSQFGFHVIRLDDVRDPQLPKFEDVKPQIAQQLMQQKMAKFQEEVRGKAKVE